MDLKSTEQGVTHNPVTGKSQVPNNIGGVTEEDRKHLVDKYGPDIVIMSKEVYAKIVAATGAQAEDAKSRGQRYEPKLSERFTNLAKQNLTIGSLFVAVAVGAGVVWVARKAGRALARRMGWNLFGNVVVMDSNVQGEEIGRQRPARARSIAAPSAPTASA